MKPPYALIDGYFEGMLSDEQFAELVDWLHALPDHARVFARWAQLRRQITEHMQGEYVATVMLDEAETVANDEALSLHGSSLHGTDFAEVLTRLDVTDDSEVELVDLSAQLQAAARQTREAYRADRREARQQAMQYLAGVGRDLATSPRLLAGLAALLAVAITAWALLPAGSPSEPVADQRQADPAPAPARPTPVATLTDDHSAQWAAFGPAPGDTLFAGQRLTLTEGFAEVTTNRGAVALLEAPATIELLDNDNALRLETGKLVGICETASSKGFVVRTEHMDITDLGTRFGVDVSAEDAAEIHVFAGEVRINSPAGGAVPIRGKNLRVGEAIRVDSGIEGFTRIDLNLMRFANAIPGQYLPSSTGLGLAVGEIDPNWQLIAIDGQSLDKPRPVRVDATAYRTRLFANDPSRSQWLGWVSTDKTGDEHTFLLRTTVEVPERISSDDARLVLRYMADNELRAVHVNGHRVDLPRFDVTGTFDKFHETAVAEHLRPGRNTLVFELVDMKLRGSFGGVGLRVEMLLETSVFDAVEP